MGTYTLVRDTGTYDVVDDVVISQEGVELNYTIYENDLTEVAITLTDSALSDLKEIVEESYRAVHFDC